MVQDSLNAVCEIFDSCTTLAYADLSTQLVLATNEGAEHTRETLNGLCAEATLILEHSFLGVVGTPTGFRVFVRSPEEPTDGLICLCGLETDMALLIPEIEHCLADIVTGDSSA